MNEINQTILTIEDDRDVRRGIAAFLEYAGFKVLEADNGRKGIEVFEREHPDLVLTDLKMPVMDGFSVISAIAQMSPGVPVVAISGTGVVTDAVEAIRRGAWDFITKPISDLNELVTIARKVLEQAEERREHQDYLSNLEGMVTTQSRQLSDLTSVDALTGLPTKSRLEEFFQQGLLSHDLPANPLLLLIELDNFNSVNHSHGNDYSDLILLETGKRLKSALRACGEVCRVNEARFAMLVFGYDKPSQLAAEIKTCFKEPFQILGQEFFISVSIGISVFPQDGESFGKLIRNADIALSEARILGRNRHVYYSIGLSDKIQERIKLETRLQHALERNEYLLNYQPKFDSKTHQVMGMEVLLRWQPAGTDRPESPAVFVPVLEEGGLIVPVGEWVLRTACSQYVQWRSHGMPPLRLSVNISVHQFHSGILVDTVRAVLQDTGMDPSCLCLEITESIVMKDIQQTIETLHAFVEMGIKLSLDDFGTGYSSLSYLRKMPLHEIKIDRSFVMNLPDDCSAVAITESIIAMAHSLNLTIVAEGVETEEQLDFFAARRCQEIQGFYFSKPLNGEDFLQFVSRSRSF
ncbi:MAG: EAL domain-containing protein [Oryzomonas sp.]|uniref:putative bifunctional diguanylate cyclase/phosphodiesterase n=1 Tax=Oryzomonas sp. TaxID=2855186 RepID=UPI00284281C1|nr:EAL domain-containing protein [Oryzomonas sp.]MDR3581358.1 EAL domain-containing protein [Oryzomonas sp.]